MKLQSMTGFSRIDGADTNTSWVWELRSVNGKNLDLRFRLPPGFEECEPELRDIATKSLLRGNIQIFLHLEGRGGKIIPVLNEENFKSAIDLAKRASEISGLKMPGLDSILSMKGIVEQSELAEDQQALDLRNKAIVKDFEKAVANLTSARKSEGRAIGKVISEQIAEIERLTDFIINDPSRSSEFIKDKLSEQVSKLLAQSDSLDPQRLYQEAAILATKADLQEELDRLTAHISAAKTLITSDQAIGRKLDFLAQEFNRECNTICSKSNTPAVTNAGLEMKVTIDQFREQIQNVQ